MILDDQVSIDDDIWHMDDIRYPPYSPVYGIGIHHPYLAYLAGLPYMADMAEMDQNRAHHGHTYPPSTVHCDDRHDTSIWHTSVHIHHFDGYGRIDRYRSILVDIHNPYKWGYGCMMYSIHIIDIDHGWHVCHIWQIWPKWTKTSKTDLRIDQQDHRYIPPFNGISCF